VLHRGHLSSFVCVTQVLMYASYSFLMIGNMIEKACKHLFYYNCHCITVDTVIVTIYMCHIYQYLLISLLSKHTFSPPLRQELLCNRCLIILWYFSSLGHYFSFLLSQPCVWCPKMGSFLLAQIQFHPPPYHMALICQSFTTHLSTPMMEAVYSSETLKIRNTFTLLSTLT
jgi:hypothetical protein